MLCGASAYFPSYQTIDSYGSLATDGWQDFAALKGSAIPTNNPEVAFVVWGSVGHIEGRTFGSNGNVVVEVGLGQSTSVGVFTDTVTRFEVRDGNMRGNLRAIPFFLVRNYQTVGGAARGVWSSAADLVVRARIFLNGDQPGSTDATARISDIVMHAFDLAKLGSTKVFTHYNATPATLNVASEGYLQLSASGVTAPDNAERWLVFSSVRYRPVSSIGAPVFQTAHLSDGTWGTPTAILGEVAGSAQFGAMGMRPRGRGAVSGAWVEYHHGGFRLFTATDNSQVGLRGLDYHNNTNERSQYVSWEVFAVDTAQLGFFAEVQKAAGSLVEVYNDLDKNPITYEPAEWGRPYFSDYHVMVGASYAAAVPQQRSYSLVIGSNSNLALSQQQLWAHTYDSDEGVLHQHGAHYPVLRPADVQYRFFGLRNPLEPQAALSGKGRDFTACGWWWENDPDFANYPQPAVGPKAVIVPGRESLGVDTLTALPIDPDDKREETYEIAEHELRVDAGYTLTWPRFLTGKDEQTWQWSRLSKTDADTISAFFDRQGVQAFKWTEPDADAADAWVAMGRLSRQDEGGKLHSLSVKVRKLVFVGVS